MPDIANLARTLDDAAVSAKATRQLSDKETLTESEGYDVQAASIGRRIARGEKRVGVKMGFTSRAKMIQMGIDDMIWGRLTDQMLIEDGGTLSMADYVHPRVEPEIAFLLGRPLAGTVTGAEALAAVEAVAPAMEIIDSRYRNFKFSLADVVADNCSSSGFVVGPWQDADADLTNLGMILEFNGRPRQIGSSAAILGNPVRALVSAARLSAAAGEPLEAGWIIMAGGATAAEALSPGDYVRNCVQHLGTVAFSVAP
jgi:2-oxo-3-hexenedioate decarboxylase